MKIHYKQKRFRFNLIFGIVWFVYVVIILTLNKKFLWNDYIFSACALVFFGTYIFEKRNQYLTITETEIRKNSLISKTIQLKDIVSVRKFAGDYTLKSPSKEMKINTAVIEEKSLLKLDKVINGLNL